MELSEVDNGTKKIAINSLTTSALAALIYHLVNHHFFSKFWDSKTYITMAIVSEED